MKTAFLGLILCAVCGLPSGCKTFTGGVSADESNAVEERVSVPTKGFPATGEVSEEEGVYEGAGRHGREWLDTMYRLGPGDVLLFRSFDNTELNQEAVIRYDGRVSLPLVPDIEVAGLTREQAVGRIKEAYLDVFKDPQVSLAVKETKSKGFFVMGDVARPNEYPYDRPVTVLEAINRAGGLRFTSQSQDDFVPQQGTLTKAFIFRGWGEGREVIECDLRKLTYPGAHSSDTLVMPGDFIFVPEGANLVYVLGDVQRPSVFQLAEGQTLMQLLARAGSPVESTAWMRHVVLLREVDSGNMDVMKVNLRKIVRSGKNDIELRPGDIVYVPRRPLVRIEEFVNRFTGTISPLLSLYTQAWEAAYTKKRLEILYDESGTDEGEWATLLRNLQTYSSTVSSYQQSVSQPPAIPTLPGEE